MADQLKAHLDPRYIVGEEGGSLYMIGCRVPGDDDDTVFLVRADSYEDAWEKVERALHDETGLSAEDQQMLADEFGASAIHTMTCKVGTVEEL